jgi:type IV pilus assembly protein PilV
MRSGPRLISYRPKTLYIVIMKKIHSNQKTKQIRNRSPQRGVMILEAMIAILIFSLGIIALMALQAAAIRLSGDAKGRTDAAFLADRLMSEIWTVDPATIGNYSYNPLPAGSTAFPCTLIGGGGGTGLNWLNTNLFPAGSSPKLPGATPDRQHITVVGNNVQVNLCWQMPGEAANNWHHYVATTSIAKNPSPSP